MELVRPSKWDILTNWLTKPGGHNWPNLVARDSPMAISRTLWQFFPALMIIFGGISRVTGKRSDNRP
jgi:hypothetical protein